MARKVKESKKLEREEPKKGRSQRWQMIMKGLGLYII